MVDPITKPRSLEDALQVWCEPSLVAEMLQLKTQGYGGPQLLFPGGPETESERKQFRYWYLRKQLEAELMEKLKAGELIATGYDSLAPIDEPASTIPADRWRTLTANFKESSATTGNVVITGIQVLRPTAQVPAQPLSGPRLRIDARTRQAQLDGTDLNLTARSFKLLVMLARQASKGAHIVPKQTIERELFAAPTDERAVARAAWRMRQEVVSAGLERHRVEELIQNQRALGYRLMMDPPEIQIVD
jgi:hypothetical protein